MYGVCFETIQKSTPDLSMMLDVVTVKPRNNPISTTISTTANTIPVSVTASRTLSCIKLRCARGGISLLPQQAVHLAVDHQLRSLLQRPPRNPRIHALGNL